MFDLQIVNMFLWDDYDPTLVTTVPVKKKTASRAKKTDQGCIACTVAVSRAKQTPSGVNDLLLTARYIRNAIAGMAILSCIVTSKI